LQRKGILQILKITAKHQGFIYLFIHSFIYTLFHLIIHLLIHLLILLLIHLFIHLFIHLLIHLFIHLLIHLLIHLFIHLLIHLLIHLPIHAFIHSFLCIHNSLCFSLAMHFCTHNNNTQRKPPQRLGGISENKSDIILNENSAFNYLLINYFSLGHQVSPIKPLLD
jgi:hypothetical protein